MEQKKQRRELSEELRMKIIDKHINGKGYKTISKQLNIPVTTVANIIKKAKDHGSVANLPGRGRKSKIDPKMGRKIERMLNKKPLTTSKEIQAELEGQGPSVSDRTIRRFLNDRGLNGKRLRRTSLIKGKSNSQTEGEHGQSRNETDVSPLNSATYCRSAEQQITVKTPTPCT